jgi:hypothetical protein
VKFLACALKNKIKIKIFFWGFGRGSNATYPNFLYHAPQTMSREPMLTAQN